MPDRAVTATHPHAPKDCPARHPLIDAGETQSSEGVRDAHLPFTRCVRAGDRRRDAADRGRRHRGRRIHRLRAERAREHTHARVELDAVRRHVRGAVRGRLPRLCRLRLLPERRRQLLRRAHRHGCGLRWRQSREARAEAARRRPADREDRRLRVHREERVAERQADQGRGFRPRGRRRPKRAASRSS